MSDFFSCPIVFSIQKSMNIESIALPSPSIKSSIFKCFIHKRFKLHFNSIKWTTADYQEDSVAILQHLTRIFLSPPPDTQEKPAPAPLKFST